MNHGRPQDSSSMESVLPDDYHAIGARYADRRGRAGAMASLGAEGIISLRGSASSPVHVLYPGTSKLSGGLLTSLIRSPDLDPNYVQRFQNIAIIAQLADAILSVAQATGKCIVPLDFDSNDYTSPEDCSCNSCSKERRRFNNNVGTKSQVSTEGQVKEKEILQNLNVGTPVGREELAEVGGAKMFSNTGDNTSLDETAPGSSACGISSYCRPPTNLTAPLQQMELQ